MKRHVSALIPYLCTENFATAASDCCATDEVAEQQSRKTGTRAAAIESRKKTKDMLNNSV